MPASWEIGTNPPFSLPIVFFEANGKKTRQCTISGSTLSAYKVL